MPASISADGSEETAEGASAGGVAKIGAGQDDLMGANSASAREVTYEDLHPRVLLKTSMGDITLELDVEKTPVTVDNFLANYVRRGHYSQTIFHYVDKDSMILGGGFLADMTPKDVRAEVFNEAPDGLKNVRGTIAMARDLRYAHSATCQFFINVADNPSLDHKNREKDEDYGYCGFGKVVDGMDVVDRIAQAEVSKDEASPMRPISPVVIESATLLE